MRLWLVLTLLPLGVGAAAQDPPPSWKGERVVGTKPDKDITFGDQVDGKQEWFAFAGVYPIIVRDERDGWLRVSDGHREAWAKKEEFVLSRDAPAYFTDRVRANPKDGWAWWMRGLGWHDRGEYDNAIKDFGECIHLDPRDAAAFNSRGLAWRGKKDDDRAIKDYDESIRLEPKYAFAFLNRGLVWYDKGELDRAVKDYDEAIRLDPKYANTFYARGLVWQNKGELDRALEDYDESIRLDARYIAAFNNRGLVWLDKGDLDRALKDFGECIRIDPKDAAAFLNRGVAWRKKKDDDRAMKDYDEAIRLDPRFAFAFSNRGLVWLDMGNLDRALRDFDEAIRHDPKYVSATHYRAVTLLLARRLGGVAGCRAVLDLQGWSGDLSAYAVIVGNLSARAEKDEPAAKAFLADSAGKLKAGWPEPVVRFLRGDLDEPALLKLAAGRDQEAAARAYLGLDHLLRGRTAAARTHFRWVRENGTKTFTEYTIALAELARLDKADPPKKP